MKNNAILFFLLGLVVVGMIYTLVQLNIISKRVNKNTGTGSTKRFLQSDINDIDESQEKQSVLRESVTAKELADAVREKLNEQKVESLNITFTN